jgi:aminopeptidase C
MLQDDARGINIKEMCHEIFDLFFSHQKTPPQKFDFETSDFVASGINDTAG